MHFSLFWRLNQYSPRKVVMERGGSGPNEESFGNSKKKKVKEEDGRNEEQEARAVKRKGRRRVLALTNGNVTPCEGWMRAFRPSIQPPEEATSTRAPGREIKKRRNGRGSCHVGHVRSQPVQRFLISSGNPPRRMTSFRLRGTRFESRES